MHLNDAYAKRDDGLMVAAVHLRSTLELLTQIRRDGYNGALYFDTFPDISGLDPVAECEANIATVNRLLAIGDKLEATIASAKRSRFRMQSPAKGSSTKR